MVTPDGHLSDIVDGRAGLLCQLRFSAVMVEARHRGKLTRVDVGALRCVISALVLAEFPTTKTLMLRLATLLIALP